ncbi:MAG: STAS domain-containing protein [Chromatiales bacterium]|nr:STAS domain-containing protein [Chromatiales bacterium]
MTFITEQGLELRIVKEKNNLALVELEGRLDSTNASDLQVALQALINDGVANIILSCGSLRYVSSAGLNVFLKAFKEVSKRGNGHFSLCSVAENIKRVLDITGFSNFIPLYADSQQARLQLQKKEL